MDLQLADEGAVEKCVDCRFFLLLDVSESCALVSACRFDLLAAEIGCNCSDNASSK